MTVPTIDKTEIIHKIGGRGLNGAEYAEATKRLIDHFKAQTNDCGVFMEAKTTLALQAGQAKANVKVAQRGEADFVMGYDTWSRTCCCGCAPSVWDRTAYASEADATQAGAERVMSYFANVATRIDSVVGDQERKEAREIVAMIIRRYKEPDLLELSFQGPPPKLPIIEPQSKPQGPAPQQLDMFS